MGSEAKSVRIVDTLFDDAALNIEHHRAAAAADTLVICFDPLLQLWPTPGFGVEFLGRCGVDVISVRKKSEHFYQTLSRERFDRSVLPVAERYAHVWAYGSSLGAYAALYFAQNHRWQVLALSPRVSVHPTHGSPDWQARQEFLHEPLGLHGPANCQARLFYDPTDVIDRAYVRDEVLPAFPQIEIVRVPFAGHPVTQMLVEMGFLGSYLRALMGLGAMPVFDRRQGRRRSAGYLHNLALRGLERGHLSWPLELLDEALRILPNYMLAHRTRGRLLLNRGEPQAARQALLSALERAPDDLWTVKLLARAEAQCQPITIELVEPVPPPAAAPSIVVDAAETKVESTPEAAAASTPKWHRWLRWAGWRR